MSDPLRYRITILGCRVNHAERREMEAILADRGIILAARAEYAELEIVHTCCITHSAAAKSRNAIRRAVRRQQESPSNSSSPEIHDAPNVPDSRHFLSPHIPPSSPEVLVTGCYAGANGRVAAQLVDSPLRVIPHHAEDNSMMIDRFTRRIDQWLNRYPSHSVAGQLSIRNKSIPSSNGENLLPLPVISSNRQNTLPNHPYFEKVCHSDMIPRGNGGSMGTGGHIRAELRIQDGCDAHCTFCIIPRIRRTLRSKTIVDTVGEARMLVDQGHREIVLTGIFIGAFGHETALRRKQRHRQSHPLADLLDAVAQIPGVERLRISSMEPGDMTEPLLDAMVANRPVVVPHLHLPLQSGSDRILKMMNRQYQRGEYLEMIDRVNEALTVDNLPPALTTDIICGFPGETDDDFEQTIEMADQVSWLHMHVFPYSRRDGTAAARWKDQHLPPPLIKSRVRHLIQKENDPQQGLSINFRRRLQGRVVRVILEQPDRNDPALMTGRCDHYALIHIPTTRPRGEIVHARITSITPEATCGEVVSASRRSRFSRGPRCFPPPFA